MANSPLKNGRAQERDSTKWSKKRLFYFQKVDLHFVHWKPGPNRPIFRDIRGRFILPVKNAIKLGSTFNQYNHKNGSTIDVHLNFSCKHYSSDEIEIASSGVEFYLYSSSMYI